ncbi:MAG: STAS domain-containing protein [Planctomycetota bacterium]|jgi:anti-anti-sigma factor
MRPHSSRGFDLTILETDRIALVELRDENLNHFTAQDLGLEIQRLMEQADRPFDSLVLNCSQVQVMDSSGASMMIRLHRIAAQESVCFVICELRELVVKSLQALNLGFAAARYDNSMEAINAVK